MTRRRKREEYTTDEEPTGLWFEITDDSERDYGSAWGYKLLVDGVVVKRERDVSTSHSMACKIAAQAKKAWRKEHP